MNPFLYIIFLPIILNSTVKAEEVQYGAYWYGVPRIEYLAKHQWVKIDSRWETTEPQMGVYDWSYLDQSINVIRNENNGFVLINIHNTPSWARVSSHKCKLPDQLFFLKRFTQLLIDRYHPDAISFWNEPEMDAETSASLQYCCGCLGAEEYRSALNYLYNNVQLNGTKFIAGELLVDKTWVDLFFSAPVMADAISFHHYNYYYDLTTLNLQITKDYLERKTELPLWLTETSLLCLDHCTDSWRKTQSYWLDQVNTVGFEKIFWYSQNNVGWRSCNMVNEFTGIYYPAWYTFRDTIQLTP